MDHIREAFFQTCPTAEPGAAVYVSLYCDTPFYGGPEEGGWWGSDTALVAYQKMYDRTAAERAKEAVTELSEKLTKDAADQFNRHCAAQCEWLEQRGLDSDYLPEVDGSERFWVAVEDSVGSFVAEGDRSYS